MTPFFHKAITELLISPGKVPGENQSLFPVSDSSSASTSLVLFATFKEGAFPTLHVTTARPRAVRVSGSRRGLLPESAGRHENQRSASPRLRTAAEAQYHSNPPLLPTSFPRSVSSCCKIIRPARRPSEPKNNFSDPVFFPNFSRFLGG